MQRSTPKTLEKRPVTEKKDTTHVLIERQLVLAQRENSDVWQCRYKVGGVWQRVSTGERDLKAAKAKAHELLIEANVRLKMDYTPVTRRFKDVAAHAIKRMDDELAAGTGKPIFEDYKFVIVRYMVPFLGKYLVDNISHSVLAEFDADRERRMGRKPTKSTLLTHNAALNRVFDEAVQRGFMVESARPTLHTRGRSGERRPSFTVEEIRAVLGNFDAWIERGRADTVPIRALLKNYVQMLVDTGARPGYELLDLRWGQIEFRPDPKFIHTGKDELGDDEFEIQYNVAYVLKIQTGKTKHRSAIGKRLTHRALGAIAKRNYPDMELKDVLKKKKREYVFAYMEWLNEVQEAEGVKPRMIRPTSFNRLFHSYLDEHNLLVDPVTGKERPFYSLRHTYATMALINGLYPIHTLAKQMGTSIAMLERHYSHLTAERAIDQLRNDQMLQIIEARPVIDEQYTFDEAKAKKQRKLRGKKGDLGESSEA